MKTVILKVALRFLVPLSLVFGAFIYFKGHQAPGGGFVGGLVVAVALVLVRMGQGREGIRKILPIRERLLIGFGLLLAVGTGIGALIAGLPFLTSNFGYLGLPGGESSFEWATVMAFDLGVVLVVAGVVVGMINALSEELQ